MNNKSGQDEDSGGIFAFNKRSKSVSPKKKAGKTSSSNSNLSRLFSKVFSSPKTVKRDSNAIANLSEDDESDDAVIEEDPVPGMISIFLSSPEEDRQVLLRALNKNQRIGDIFLEIPKQWSSQHVSSFSTWAIKLGLRRSYVGIQMRLSIPHGHISNLRRCVSAASRITSSDESFRTQTTLLNSSVTLNAEQTTSINQSRVSELSELSYASLRQLCKDCNIKTTGRKQDLIDRIVSVENAVRQGLSIREERSITSYVPKSAHQRKRSRDQQRIESLSDDESLLHQLRREEFERNHKNQDYYRDSNGRYNISLDDQSSFSDSTSLAVTTTFLSPTMSRVNRTFNSPHKNVLDTSSFLGDLPRFSILQKKLHRRRATIMEFHDLPPFVKRPLTEAFHRLSFLHYILPYIPPITRSLLQSSSSLVSSAVLNWRMNDIIDHLALDSTSSFIDLLSENDFLNCFPQGELIGEGGYKIVFQVQHREKPSDVKKPSNQNDQETMKSTPNKGNERQIRDDETGIKDDFSNDKIPLENKQFSHTGKPFNNETHSTITGDSSWKALGVMDLESLRKNDLIVVAQQELRIALLCSLLASHAVLPQFPQIFDIFRASFPPPFVTIQSPSSDYLYFVMELANQTDLEHVIRTIDLQPNELVACFFQMVLALYVANQGLGLVHYDVKLLNFLLQQTPGNGQQYFLPWGSFSIPAVNGFQFVVKLNDFGTAELNQQGAISVGQFTTLENTPVFYLLEPYPQRGSHCDRWCLGLCLLHLLSGHEPYEEWMEECRCPAGFAELVKSFWQSKSGEFRALQKVLKEDESDALALTLYRQLVLWFRSDMPADLVDSSLWKRIHSLLTRDSVRNKRDRAIRESFEKDVKRFSWLIGDHPNLVKARARCQQIAGAENVLLNLVGFDWQHQMSFEELLQSELFVPLKKPVAGCSARYTVNVEKIHAIMFKSL